MNFNYFYLLVTLFPFLLYYWYPRINDKTNKNGGDLVAKVLKSHGIKHLFTLVGGHVSPILVAAKRLGIKIIDVRHEVNAVFAADACGRLTKTPGVAIVTAGPGVTNTITAMKNALMAESPLVLIGGASATLLKGRGSLQDIDQLSLMKTACKNVYSCNKVKNIVDTLKTAFQTASSYPCGPVFVELPIDTLYPYSSVMKELGNLRAKNIIQKIINFYIKTRVKLIFDRAFNIKYNFNPLTLKKLGDISNYNINKTVNILNESNKPLLVIGGQIIQNKNKLSECINILKKLNIPCYLTSMGRGIMGQSNNLQYFHNRTDALRDADTIILLGVTCDFRMGYGKKLNKKAKIISVNHSKEKLNLNHKIFWNANVKIHGNICEFLKLISDKFTFDNNTLEKRNWFLSLYNRDKNREKQIDKFSEIKYDNLVNPISLLQKFKSIIGDNSIIVVDGGDFVGTAAYVLKPNKLGWLDPGPFGTLGVGAGFALGAKLSYPEKDVWIIYGDGSCGYSLMEYDTFVRHNIKINSLIGNDACWSQIEREQLPMFNDDVACKLEYTDYQKFTHILNDRVNGILIKTEDELDDKLQEIKKSNKSVIVNALIAKTDFRKGSISV